MRRRSGPEGQMRDYEVLKRCRSLGFFCAEDEHVSRSSYGTNRGFLAKISTRKSINTLVFAARRRLPALSANMDFLRSYSGSRRRTAPDAISFANSHAGPLAMPRWLSTATRICSAARAKVALGLVDDPARFFFEYPRARRTLMHVRHGAMLF